MSKQCVRWKTYKAKALRGPDYESSFPAIIEISYRGSLIFGILAMEEKQPISFETAARLAEEKSDKAMDEGLIGYGRGKCFWYQVCFVEWISSLGYHIELTGDEFEAYYPSENLI